MLDYNLDKVFNTGANLNLGNIFSFTKIMRLIILSFTILITTICHAQQKGRFYLHTGAGWQDDMLPIGTIDSSKSFGDYYYSYPSIAGGYLDLGGAYRWGKSEVGLSLRLNIFTDWNMLEQKDELAISFFYNAFYAYYFGKADGRGFRVGITTTAINYPVTIYADNGADPNLKPNLPANNFYMGFGPNIGTRIIRKGFLKDTYLNFGAQVAPPDKFDKIVLYPPLWSKRFTLGITRNISFKKEDR